MMRRLNHDQGQFFYSFRLDEAVPADHPMRQIARVLDLSWVHSELAPFYSNLGRPSIDPELMIRMLIIGYVVAIRSERALCRDVQVNLAYRWFCGLSIEDKVPDHSAFSRARHERFRDSDIFRQERGVEACIAAGLVGGEGFAVDASLIAADANKQRSIPGTEWRKTCAGKTASRPRREYLATLDDAAFGAASEVTPKFVSPSDPAAQWTGAMRGPAFFAYADNYLIDVKFGGIGDVKASRAIRQADVGAAKAMIERTQERFDLKPTSLAADTAYGSAETLNWLVNDKDIEPHIPIIDKSMRYVPRDLHEDARDVARALAKTEALTVPPQSKARRDAVCPPQAHFETGPASLARPTRRARRVYTRRYCAEPSPRGKAGRSSAAISRCVSCVVSELNPRVIEAAPPGVNDQRHWQNPAHRPHAQNSRLPQQNLPIADIGPEFFRVR
jgi:transposase